MKRRYEHLFGYTLGVAKKWARRCVNTPDPGQSLYERNRQVDITQTPAPAVKSETVA